MSKMLYGMTDCSLCVELCLEGERRKAGTSVLASVWHYTNRLPLVPAGLRARLGEPCERGHALPIQALRVDLNNMPVWVADVDLRVPSGGMGLQDHAVRIVRIC